MKRFIRSLKILIEDVKLNKREKIEINISKDIEDIQLYNEARVNEKNKVKKIDNIIEELDLR